MNNTPESFSIHPALLAAVCMLIGIAYLVITPPMQVPDEQYHFYRAYQVSEGVLFSEKRGGLAGGELPASLSELHRLYSFLVFNPEEKTNPEITEKAVSLALDPQNRVFTKFESTAIFPFPAYTVPAIAIAVTRLVDSRPIVLMYAARLANLLFGVFILFLVFRLFRQGVPLFLLLALLPMYMFEMASVSSDSFSNSIAFLFIALLARSTQDDEFFQRAWPAIVLTGMLVVSSKQTYSVILLLLLLVPPAHAGSGQRYLVKTSFFYALAGTAFIAWAMYARSVYVPLSWHPGANAEKQIAHMIEYPYDHFMVFVNDIYYRWDRYLRMWVGELLGWVDTRLPGWLVIYYLLLFPLALLVKTSFSLNLLQRTALIILAIIGLFVVEAAIYIHTAYIASTLNDHVHGRYLIPFVPLLGLALLGLAILRPLQLREQLITPLILLLGTLGSAISLWTVYSRYYVVS